MRAIFLVAFLLALPALALAAPRHGRTSHHRSQPAPAAQQAPQAAPAPAPAATAEVGDPLTTLQSNAQFAVIMDFDTGALLFSKDGDQVMKPASMAKLMTVAILFEKLKHGDVKLDDKFLVSEAAWRQGMTEKSEGSKMFVQ